MKTLMITAATSALMLGMAACSQSSDDIEMDESEYSETETDETGMEEDADGNLMDAETDAEDTNQDITYLASGELSAGNLIGAEVTGADGEQVAVVDDLLLGSSGQVESIIFRASDMLDFTGDKGALAYDELDMTMADGDDPRFSVSMTDEAIQNVAEFDQEGLNDYSLVSEMIGTNAPLADSDDDARIEDLVINQSGMVQYAVISDPAMMGEMRVLEFDRISVQGEGDSEIMINATAEEIDGMPLFEYVEEADMDDMSTSGEMDATDEMDTDMTDGDMDEESDTMTPQ